MEYREWKRQVNKELEGYSFSEEEYDDFDWIQFFELEYTVEEVIDIFMETIDD